PAVVLGNPRYLALAGTRLYVADAASRIISVIDTASNTVIDTFTVPRPGRPQDKVEPSGLAITPAGTRLYVTHAFGLAVMDTASHTVIAAVAEEARYGLNKLAINSAGTRVYATDYDGETTWVVDATC